MKDYSSLEVVVDTEIEYHGYKEDESIHIFKYQINIKNLSTSHIKLLRRKWVISDGLVYKRIVEGEGVVGEQPEFYPGDLYSYSSWCPIPATVGTMDGEFVFVDLDEEREFVVPVPRMHFVAVELLN